MRWVAFGEDRKRNGVRPRVRVFLSLVISGVIMMAQGRKEYARTSKGI